MPRKLHCLFHSWLPQDRKGPGLQDREIEPPREQLSEMDMPWNVRMRKLQLHDWAVPCLPCLAFSGPESLENFHTIFHGESFQGLPGLGSFAPLNNYSPINRTVPRS